jgi:LPS sulfotransferase NodH
MPDSFTHRIKAAARILLKGIPPNGDLYRQRPRRSEFPSISAEEVAEAKTFFPLEKFFIFGHARSGTTLLTRLIRLHPEVHCNYQAHFFTRSPFLQALVADPEVAAWLSQRSNRWNRGRDLSPVVLRAASDFILEREARRVGKSIVGDKSPNNTVGGQAVQNLHAIYPDAYLIFIVRDGRDALLSHRFQDFVDRTEKLSPADVRLRDEFTRQPEPYLTGQRSLFSEGRLRSEASSWVRNLAETEALGKSLFGGHGDAEHRYIHLRYEDLLAEPWRELSRLWKFLQVKTLGPELEAVVAAEMQSNPDAEWQMQKDRELAHVLQKGQRGNWRNMLTARDRAIVKEIAAQALIDWQYETDSYW